MAINRARLRGIMVSGGIAAKPPALEFTEALDEEIEESQGGLVRQDLLDAKFAAQDARLMVLMEQKLHQQTKFYVGALIGVAGISTAIISIVVAVT